MAKEDIKAKGSVAQKNSWWKHDNIQFLFCVFGIYFSYLIFGFFQEALNIETFGPEKKKFRNTPFLLLCQCLVDAIAARAIIYALRIEKDKTPVMEYAYLSFSYVGAMFCTNWAIQYVSFPTMVLAKSCKPIPVMLMGVLVLGKRQPFIKYVCVSCITLGIALFMLQEGHGGKARSTVDNSSFGLILLCISLALDGVTGPFQERLIIRHNPSQKYMMYYINMWASAILLVVLLVTGQGVSGVMFCIEHPSIIPQILLYAVTSAIGQNFIYLTIYKFGALVCSLTTTTRKFFTILLSVLWFGNSLSSMQWLGVAVVFLGLSIDMYSSSMRKQKAH